MKKALEEILHKLRQLCMGAPNLRLTEDRGRYMFLSVDSHGKTSALVEITFFGEC